MSAADVAAVFGYPNIVSTEEERQIQTRQYGTLDKAMFLTLHKVD